MHQGVVQHYRIDERTNKWLYDIRRENGTIWKNLEENRMLLVIDGVTPPFQHWLAGLPVMAYDLDTGEVVAEGIALGVSTTPTRWNYQIRTLQCEVFWTDTPGRRVRTVLVNALSRPVECRD